VFGRSASGQLFLEAHPSLRSEEHTVGGSFAKCSGAVLTSRIHAESAIVLRFPCLPYTFARCHSQSHGHAITDLNISLHLSTIGSDHHLPLARRVSCGGTLSRSPVTMPLVHTVGERASLRHIPANAPFSVATSNRS
jgi:hypothetical protein